MFQLPQDANVPVDGEHDTTPTHLPGVTADEFRCFVRLLCPRCASIITMNGNVLMIFRGYDRHQPFDFDHWAAILKLSSLWMFDDIRTFAIKSMEEFFSKDRLPIKAITLGREFKIAKWVKNGFNMLITRKDTLSDTETEVLGWKSTIAVFRSREAYRLAMVESDVLCICGKANSSLECYTCRSSFALKDLAHTHSRIKQTNFNLVSHVEDSFAHELVM